MTTAAERKWLVGTVISERRRFPIVQGIRLPSPPVRADVLRDFKKIEKLTSAQFVRTAVIPIIALYRVHQFAQSRQNMANSRIAAQTIRREITKLANAWAKGEEARVTALLAKISPQSLHSSPWDVGSLGITSAPTMTAYSIS
jgi:hypothetical protein